MVRRIVRAVPILLMAFAAEGATTHYDVKLIVDLENRQIHGREEIRFEHGPGSMEWQKQAALQILKSRSSSGDVTPTETAVNTRIHSGGLHRVTFEYRANASRGFRWLSGKSGLFTAFYCQAWMICSTAPDQRATLKLEIVVKESNLTAVGPGRLRKKWRDRDGSHFLFEQPDPAQTYLFSFCVAELVASTQDDLTVWASTPAHLLALRKTADAAAFMRSKAGVNAIAAGYAQAFLSQPGLAQEAAGLALLSSGYLDDLERADNVVLMAH
jgi:aminopeptidase N